MKKRKEKRRRKKNREKTKEKFHRTAKAQRRGRGL